MSEKTGGIAIGIDLGTTYSCVGYWKDDRVEIITNDQGNRITPSYVAFTEIERLVGDAAFNQVALNSVNTIFDAKRLIGRKYSDESVQSDMKLWPFKVISGTEDRPKICVTYKGEEKQFSAEEISSMVLMKMKEIAEKYIGSAVSDAVVTVPAYFDQSQRQATMDAAEIAGLNVLNIINEPTAAAIAYGLENSLRFRNNINVLVFDLGGGTFDVAVITIKNSKNIEVKAIAGDTHLGGEDFDSRMVNHFMEEFKRKHNKDMSGNPRALRRLRTACERAKRMLSSASDARIDIDAMFEGMDFSARVSRPLFEQLNIDLFNRCIEIVDKCLVEAKMRKNYIDDIVLVGGSSRIPKVQQMLQELLGGKELCGSINPDEAVAYGAAVQAANMTNLQGDDNNKVHHVIITEVTALSLGIATNRDVMRVVIPRNTPIPTRKLWRDGLTTSFDNQTGIVFPVYEGERVRSTENKLLGTVIITGIEMAPRGVPRIDVCFDLQANGILIVSAMNKYTGKETSIAVKSGRLSENEREMMIEEANKCKDEDEKVIMKNKARTAFRTYVCTVRDKIETKENMHSDSKKEAGDAVEKAFQWLDAEKELAEVSEYEAKTRELELLV